MPAAVEVVGFAPESVYAEWTTAQREASDRMEAEANSRQSAVLARRDAADGHTVRGMADDSLRRMAVRLRRDLEDIEAGDQPAAKRAVTTARLRDVEGEQAIRGALAECWLASEDGTHCYTGFMARGGLGAVLDHGAVPASYWLAETLDWRNWRQGKAHVLAWSSADGEGN